MKEQDKYKTFQEYYKNGMLAAEVVQRMDDFWTLHKTCRFDPVKYFMYCHENKVLDVAGSAHSFGNKSFGCGSVKSGFIRLNDNHSYESSLSSTTTNTGVHEHVFYTTTTDVVSTRTNVFQLPEKLIDYIDIPSDVLKNPEEVYFQFSTVIPEQWMNLYAFYSALRQNCTADVQDISCSGFSSRFMKARLKKLNSAIEKIEELIRSGEFHNLYEY